ncbi:major facilitator superfamily domain-containing protein [Chiua virens]|nr:major facilitator superfamily domain-containing protein [Chiua virens]
MTRRSAGRVEDSLHPDEHSSPNHERSTLLDVERDYSSLTEVEDEEHAVEVASWKSLPWWKRPSPYWLIFGIPLGSIGYSATLAPKVSLYTDLVCRVHRPEYVINEHAQGSLTSSGPLTHTITSITASAAPAPQVSDGGTGNDTVSIHFPTPSYTAWSDYIQSGLDEQKCASDPVVQAVVAKLSAAFVTTTGILSCLTTGWWGSLSDRYGRRIVVFVAILGLLMTDLAHVITVWYVDVLPGGYWFPMAGSFLDGLFGSLSSGMAVNQAYLADTTHPSTRSRYFSLSLGLVFFGGAVGPILGGLIIRLTGSLLSVFYFVCLLHMFYSTAVLLILPESLTRARARGARLRRKQYKANQVSNGLILDVLKRTTSFLSPLTVLLPERASDTDPLKRNGKDWSLFCIAVPYGLILGLLGSLPYKFQYAAAQFNWTPEITSYFVSFVGITRAIVLATILPLIIKYLQPTSIQLPSTPDDSVQDAGLSSSRGTTRTNTSEKPLGASGSPAFDLSIARVSAWLEGASFVFMALASTGTLYSLASVIGSIGAGFVPAAQSLALEIYLRRRPENRGEVGKLFGALSVLQALASQIISPAMFGFVYSNTVAFFPQAFMIVAASSAWVAVFLLAFVRVPSKVNGDRVLPGSEDEEGNQRMVNPPTLITGEDEEIARR